MISKWKFMKNEQNKNMRPCARWGHSFIRKKNTIILFGGYQSKLFFNLDSNYLNDLWIYCINTQKWKILNTIGDIPEPRSNFSMNYD